MANHHSRNYGDPQMLHHHPSPPGYGCDIHHRNKCAACHHKSEHFDTSLAQRKVAILFRLSYYLYYQNI